jgi:D-alanyl-D-alanine carboxypeptidase
MKRRKKRLMRKVVIVGAPVAIIITLSYASIAFLSQASEATFAYEHYFDDKDSDSKSEYDYINSQNKSEEDDLEKSREDVVFTVPAKLDTTPDSITALVNKELCLPAEYIPEDLVIPNIYFNFQHFDEKKQMRAEAAKALEELFDAASKEDIMLCGVSGYRSYQRQYEIFTNNVRTKGMDHTSKYSAVPGYSEHQTGLSIDVSSKSVNYRLDSSFGETVEGKWLAENAHHYGYIIRFPEGKSKITGYSYEPWHIRYVGKDLATFIYKNDLTLEEYYGFEPSFDYSDSISYDNLVDYGIDLDDVKKKPVVTPAVPKKEDDKNKEDTEDKEKDDKEEDSKTDKDKNKDKDKPDKDKNNGNNTGKEDIKDDSKEDPNKDKDTGKEEESEDPNSGQEPEDGESTTPSPTPSPDPNGDTEGGTETPADPNANEIPESTVTPLP